MQNLYKRRLLDQAKGEELAGLKSMTPSGQYVHTLINKGDVFRGCIEQDISSVQAGLLIETFLNETLGEGWICHSFLANGSEKGYYPQVLHMIKALCHLGLLKKHLLWLTLCISLKDVNDKRRDINHTW